jgi:putative copper resistance protein D
VTPVPAPPAPDFAFEQAGQQETLREASEKEPVLLVLYRLPSSRTRLQQLAAAESQLGSAGLRVLAVPIDGHPVDTEASGPLPDFTATTNADTAAAFALFEGTGDAGHCEFLVDRAGFLRARWKPGTPAGLADTRALTAQLDRIAGLPLQEQTHVHAH